MTFTVLSTSKFLPSYDESSVIAYLAGLKNIYRDRFQLNNPTKGFTDEGFNAHLLSHDTLHLDYSIKGRDSKVPPLDISPI